MQEVNCEEVKIAEISLASDGRQAGRQEGVLWWIFSGKDIRKSQFTDFAIMANNRHNEDYCRALTLEYNAESGGGGTTTGVGRQRHRLGPSIITPTSRSSSRGSCFVCCGQFFSVLLRFRGDSEELEQRYKSREIDKFLKKDKPTLRKQVSRRICFLFCFPRRF